MKDATPHVRGESHRFSLQDCHFLLDVASCAAFRIDDAAATVFEALSRLPRESALEELALRPQEIPERAVREWDVLLSRGLLQTHTAPSMPPDRGLAQRTIELSITHRCTLACRYCYSAHDAEGRDVPLDMSDEVIDAALSWGVNEFAKDCPHVHFTTGVTGEGLLRLDAYRHLRAGAERLANETGKRISCAVGNTNLTLASDPEVWDVLTDPKRHVWSISIDGPPDVHDAMRCFPDGRGSYDTVSSSASRLIELGQSLLGQAVISGDRTNITEIFLHLHELGFKQIVLRPMRARPDAAFGINAETVDAVKRAYAEFVDFLFAQDDRTLLSYLQKIWHEWDFLGRFLLRVVGRHGIVYRCSAGKEIVAVDTNGDIYPCPGMVGVKELRMGSVFSGVEPKAASLYHHDMLVTRKRQCRRCWARYFCGGGCYHSAFLVNGRVDQPDPYDCALTQHLIELAIYAAARLSLERPSVLAALPHPLKGLVDVRTDIPCLRADRELSFDAPIAHWQSRQPLRFEHAHQVKGRIWHGPADLSGEVHFCWDADHLYVAAIIAGTHAETTETDRILDIWLALPANVHDVPSVVDWFEYVPHELIAFCASSPDVSVASGTGRVGCAGARTTQTFPACIEHTDGRIEMRAAIPWTALHLGAPRSGTVLAVNAAICAEGADDKRSGMKWLADFALGCMRLRG